MKNIFKVFGFIALLAVIGFSMSACDNGGGGGGGGSGDGGGGLVGKWQSSTGYFIITFTATKFTWKNDSDLEFYSGTYEFDPSTGTGTLNDKGGDMPFTLSDGLLTVSNFYTFRKKW